MVGKQEMSHTKIYISLYIFDYLIENVIFLNGDSFQIPFGSLQSHQSLSEIVDDIIIDTLGSKSSPTQMFLNDILFQSDSINIRLGIRLLKPHINELVGDAEWIPINHPDIFKNTSLDLSSIRELVSYQSAIADLENIPSAIGKAVDYLASCPNKENDLLGWDHHLDSTNRVGVIGTAMVIITLSNHLRGKYIEILLNSVSSLAQLQLPSYGWGTRSLIHSKLSIIPATAYAILALSMTRNEKYRLQIDKAVEFLKSTQIEGGWCFDEKGTKPMLTPTTLVVTSLSSIDHPCKEQLVHKAIQWILLAQHPSGGWGCYSKVDTETSPTPAHTARAIVALLDSGIPAKDKCIMEGINWLLNNRSPNGSWADSSDSELLSDGSGRLDFKHAGLPWALIALQRSGYSIENPVIARGMQLLIETQKSSGAWELEMASGHIPSWLMHDNIKALSYTRDFHKPHVYSRLLKDDSIETEQMKTVSHFIKTLQLLVSSSNETEYPINDYKNLREKTLEFIEKKSRKKVHLWLWIYLTMLIVLWGSLVVVVTLFGWSTIEPLIFFGSLLISISILIYFAVTKRVFNIQSLYLSLIDTQRNKLLIDFGIDDSS